MSEKEKNDMENQEVTLVIGKVIENFIKEAPVELSQEEQIASFELKPKKESQKIILTEEEKKKQEAKEKEDEETLKKQKAELLASLNVRIPAIEKRIYGSETQKTKSNPQRKNGKTKEKVDIKKDFKPKEKDDKNSKENKGFER